jgi:hypothetical protein
MDRAGDLGRGAGGEHRPHVQSEQIGPMRQGSNTRRPRSRGNGKRHPSASKNQTVESSGPEGKVRGTAQQVYDKYVTLSRDALTAGDRLAAETFAQFADHYYRQILSSREEERLVQVQQDANGGQSAGNQGGGDEQPPSQPQNPRGVPVAEMQETMDATAPSDAGSDVQPESAPESAAEPEVTAP